jgi:chromosome partitioning protein
LACLGAILLDQPAAYVLTDPDRKIRSKGKPYEVLDGTDLKDLARILKASQTTSGGWSIIDGGGNRPAFDSASFLPA